MVFVRRYRGSGCKSIDLSSFFGEEDLIVLRFLDVSRTGLCISVPPGFSVVLYSVDGDIEIIDSHGLYLVTLPCWVYIIKSGGRCDAFVEVRDGSGSMIRFRVILLPQTRVIKPRPETLSSILQPLGRDRVVRLCCGGIGSEVSSVVWDIVSRDYGGDLRGFYGAFYSGVTDWFVDRLMSELFSLRVMAPFISLIVQNVEFVRG